MKSLVTNLWKKFQKPKLYIDVGIDHMELGETYLILGIYFDWHNKTEEPIAIEEIKIIIFPHGRREKPVHFEGQGRFERAIGHRGITRKHGQKPFVVQPGKAHLVGLRFITHTVNDLENRDYLMEIHAKVANGTYIHESQLKVTSRVKFRPTDEWTEEYL
jgi:hypothetical protein